MSKKIALFPGSFDPFTKGHEDIVEKALHIFDEIVVAFGVNQEKKYCFELQKRLDHVLSLYKNVPFVKVSSYTSLTVDFAKEIKATHLIRGLRDAKDFMYEHPIAVINKKMTGIESVFFITEAEFAAISSTIVREIYKTGGKIDAFVTNSFLLV